MIGIIRLLPIWLEVPLGLLIGTLMKWIPNDSMKTYTLYTDMGLADVVFECSDTYYN